jgi:hypothetical protein
LVDTLTISGEGRLGATPEDVERSGCASMQLATLKSQCCPILAEQINSTEPRYSAKGHHVLGITVCPRPLSVTESFALPPQPKAVNMSDVNKFSLREWLVPPILLPIFLVLLVAAAMLIQW